MSEELFFRTIANYCDLSPQARSAWAALLRPKQYARNSQFVTEGQIPATAAFVVTGLFAQYYTAPDGNSVVKYFFPEGRIAASVSAMLLDQPSRFTITALEPSTVLEYDFAGFKQLVTRFADVAVFYIRYMERHWIIEKEPVEISLRHDSAVTRYQNFIRQHALLLPRLKQHTIAAYLGITPESLSRMKKELGQEPPAAPDS